ncbi:MAG: cytochrome c oxidase accessory protein CcoG [Myxococcales bacterium]|nr:cytochrome c oxidase accessory protein CcoG [Myxococcales bacterium]MCB9580634.1 cytochrome c oxidase accessory protein CcoG [Polyangiaceae bacterium]
MAGPLAPEERVLPTLNADGTRRRIRPKLYKGRYYWARLLTAWGLIASFVAIPFIRMNGHPLILLDVPARQFHLFGRTFLATDGVLLMLLMLSIFLSIIWLTALVGRAWCGWGCPQTVYMEFVFRPIERLFEGGRADQLRIDKKGPNARRILKYVAFGLLSVVVGNVFLSYFVGVERLFHWMTEPPMQHAGAFGVMAVTAALVFFDFAYFREQMCTVICPYARLQSVLLDKRSLVVGYDARRGEPRSKGKPVEGSGDCIDCNACVVACPTGIDIREGLQLECIACTQCADACDSIMERIGKPKGLVRYSSQETLESGEKSPLLRPRVVLYPLVILIAVSALVFFGSRQGSADVTVLRGIGAPYVLQPEGVQNQIRIKIENRGSQDREYHIALEDGGDAKLIAPENPLHVAKGTHETTTVFVLSPKSSFQGGKRMVKFAVRDDGDFKTEVQYKLLGPFDGDVK